MFDNRARRAKTQSRPRAKAAHGLAVAATLLTAGQAWAQPPAPGPAFDIYAIDVDGNTLLDEAALDAAIYPHLGPGRTLADVEAAQKALEEAYRARGYQSVVVEVPRQDPSKGVIQLHVAEAPIGRLRVVGAKYHSSEALKAQLPALAEGAVTNFTDAQTQITEANRLPDRQVTPIVRAGQAPGTVDVDLQVVDAPPLHGSLELNNDNSQFTTPLRLTANLRYDNLWQLGHSISATYVVAPQRRSDSEVYAGSYVAPIWGTPFSALVYGFRSDSNLSTLGGVDVLGPGQTVGVRGIYQFPLWGPVSQSLSFGIDYKDFREVDRLPTAQVTGGEVTYFPLNATYTLRRQTMAATTTASVALTANLRGAGDNDIDFQTKRAFARADFLHLNVDLEHQQSLWADVQLDARLSGQTTNTPLVSSEQFAAGGFNSVRGYLSAEAVGDDGVFGSFELRSPELLRSFKPWVRDWRLFAFVDAASVWVLKPQAEQTAHFTLSSAGVGARLRLLDHLSGDVDIAFPLKDGPATSSGAARTTFSLKSDF